MSYSWIWLLIPVLLWFYSGILLVRLLGPGFDEWRGAKYLKPYWNLLTLFAGPVMALVMWGYQLLDLVWLLLGKLFGSIFGKLKPAAAPGAVPGKQPGSGTVRLIDSRGEAVTGDDSRTTGRARETLRKSLAAMLDKNQVDLAMEPKPNGISIVTTEQKGKWVPVQELDSKLAAELIHLVKLLAGLSTLERSKVQSGVFTIRRDGASCHFAVETVGTFGGEKLKIHRKGTEPPMTLTACGLTPAARKMIAAALANPTGMILIAARPGSGASTTFRALLAEIDPRKRAVVTVEDSADALLPGIDRRETGAGRDNTFAALTAEAVQASPALLGLDQLRDATSARSAFDAASSMLVIFTVAADTLEEAVRQMAEWGISQPELATRLRLAIVQRQLRKLCKCRRKATPAPEVLEYFAEAGFKPNKTCAPAGCRNCGETGFLGTTAVFDLCGAEALEEVRGNAHLAYEGFRLAAEGITSVDEVQRAILTDGE